MEHKRADRPDWRRVTDRSFEVFHKDDGSFNGKVTMIHLKKVSEPLLVQYKNHKICIADSGYTWLQHFPEGKKYTITTVLDQNGDVVQFYIDLCKEHGVDEEGIPWLLDLDLDIVILPDKEIFILDENELMEAFNNGDISKDDMELAYQTAEKIISLYNNGDFEDLQICKKHSSEWILEKKSV